MATGYKRDSRGRFAGGYGAGALGGKGAYSGRQSRPAARGGSLKSSQPKGIKQRLKLSSKTKGKLRFARNAAAGAAVGGAAGYAMSRGLTKAFPPGGRMPKAGAPLSGLGDRTISKAYSRNSIIPGNPSTRQMAMNELTRTRLANPNVGRGRLIGR